MNILHQGIGEAVGDTLITCAPLQLTGSVAYVCSLNGVDTGPFGRERGRPLATLARALALASSGGDDIIVLLPGHDETITTSLAFTKRVAVVGSGLSDGKPAAKLRSNTTSIVSAASTVPVDLRNIYFTAAAGTATLAAAKVPINAAMSGSRITGCLFECSEYDALGAVDLQATAINVRIQDTKFVAVGSSQLLRPGNGLYCSGAGVTDIDLNNVTFDDGAYGFVGAAANTTLFAITRLKARNMSALNGARPTLHNSTTGYAWVTTSTGGGKLVW